ncbi:MULTISPECIES: hypothetical protein [Paraburkholderia]|jgi:hypothetical protein|nr:MULTISPECIES: hypothetical protein [Paraburkholderia]MCP2091134.1 hypothetical protein [Paraburkholderia sediminicola]MCX4140711.1 hypothetical protein [Paraburkholderia aspalathi]MDN7173395.1 hypothetical protein [Paraburkholderia sp. SEWSISQ10-3 4]MDQ6503036.1 hypothetical protein [Paraburkholderia aspalathi]CAE6756991.1 hypothetical protein R20943_03191 [Paraburkholderia aspalathi]
MSTTNKLDTSTSQGINALITTHEEGFKVPADIVTDGSDLVPTLQYLA